MLGQGALNQFVDILRSEANRSQAVGHTDLAHQIYHGLGKDFPRFFRLGSGDICTHQTGGMQMQMIKRAGRMQVKVMEETNPLQNYKPCVDITFESLADSVGNRVLGIILTGMGADGCEGCNKLKGRGATIWAQDQETSTIYGMPAAVATIAEQILPLKEIGKKIALNS